MGGVLPRREQRAKPRFLLHALKDPDGANLARMQVVKGWLDAEGEPQERVYDVALSDGRVVDPHSGKAPPVKSTVEVEQATYSNSVGEVSLSAVWQDPDFDASRPAFYYVRVIEIPTPRWTAYDARFFDLDLADEIPRITQERVYSSPIWYDPDGKR